MKKTIIFILALILIFQVYIVSFDDKKIHVCNKINTVSSIDISSIKDEYDIINDNFDFIPAKVIDNYNGLIDNIFLINKGSNENIKNYSFVVNGDGLVGQIVKTFNHYSVVRLIFSSKTKIGIETNGCYVTLHIDNGNLVIDDLINCGEVAIGDAIFTSKYNYSSSNILIGTIKNFSSTKIFVKPSVNKYEINYVGVIND